MVVEGKGGVLKQKGYEGLTVDWAKSKRVSGKGTLHKKSRRNRKRTDLKKRNFA